MTRVFQMLMRDRKGATAIEYGLIVALIVIACVGAFGILGNQIIALWNFVSSNVAAHAPS
ncbi:MAG: Flp family type IVb pilin [Alphaproteobacteria bacterium]|nr:Flp family type IVb pilin [Alphaproteobacteria bacterium]MDE2042912.1 Flp family type IVb pilin [Alphaproteobacteria bacterium]MDE2340794.1 Flp family type IVb pilin [Alphaproteobacteria bacterium]